jgi:hypothetical protein
LVKETSTDNEFYTLENFMKRYGWSKNLTAQITANDWSMSFFDLEDSTEAGALLENR